MPEAQASSPQEQEFKDWLLHPVTKRLFQAARERRDSIKEEWASGRLTDPTFDGMLQLNARGIARCQEMEWLLEIEFTDLFEEMSSVKVPE